MFILETSIGLNTSLVKLWNNAEKHIQAVVVAANVSKLKCKLSCCCKTKCIPHKRLPERREEEAPNAAAAWNRERAAGLTWCCEMDFSLCSAKAALT